MKTFFSMAVMGILVCSLTACVAPACCGPEDEEVDSVGKIEDFVGLWNSSTNSEAGEDIIYTRIMHNGDIIEYDFDGDSIDKGMDCYTVETGYLYQLFENVFMVEVDMHQDIHFKIALKLLNQGRQLEVYHLQPIADNSDASFTPYAEIWRRVDNDIFLNEEPTCSP